MANKVSNQLVSQEYDVNGYWASIPINKNYVKLKWIVPYKGIKAWLTKAKYLTINRKNISNSKHYEL